MVGGAVSRILQVMFLGYWVSNISGKRLGILTHQPNKDLEYLVDLFKAGQLKPVIDRTFHLHEVPEALQYLGDGQVQGKVIVKIFQDE
jgi:NADPH:quinone reductase-like Zn-dependent oxidoreductase